MATKMTGCRGAVPVVILVYVLAGAALTQLVPNWRVTNWFKPAPPIAALQKAEADLAKAKAEAEQAKKSLADAQAERERNTKSQLQYAQQMMHGTGEALAKAPPSAPVSLAVQLTLRANTALAAAIGDLPPERQAEIVKIVEDALSGVQARLDDANAQLARRDKDLAAATAENAVLSKRIPVLETQVKESADKIVTIEEKRTTLTAQVVHFAQEYHAKDIENGSLGATVGKLLWIIGIIAMGYIFVHILLPNLVAEFPGSQPLSLLYRWATSVTSSHTITPPKT